MSSVADLDASLSNEELRRRLTNEFKVNVGPVTTSTRRVLLKKLAKLEKGRSSPSLDDSRHDVNNASNTSINQAEESTFHNGNHNGASVQNDSVYDQVPQRVTKRNSPRRYSPRRKTMEEIEAIQTFKDVNKQLKKKQAAVISQVTPKSTSRNVLNLTDSKSPPKLHQYSSESSESEDDSGLLENIPPTNNTSSSSFLHSRIVLPRIFTGDSSKQPLSRPPIRRVVDSQAKPTGTLLAYSDSESDVDDDRNVKLTKMLLSHRPGLNRFAPPSKKASGVKAFFSNLLQKLVPRQFEALTNISFSSTFIYAILLLIAAAVLYVIVSTYVWPISIACVVVMIISAVYIYYRRTKKTAWEEQCLVFELVDKSIELLQSPDEPRSMPVLHIRDTLLSPSEKNSQKYRRIWNKVVSHVENSDSRVKVEFVKIDGEDFKTWKWIASNPGANYLLNDNEVDLDGSESEKIGGVEWQGQAFGNPLGATGQSSSARVPESNDLANESLTVSSPSSKKEFEAPTRFLKIRNIFEKEAHFLDPNWAKKIKNTILEKTAIYVKSKGLSNSHDIQHIEIENAPNEGLVYMKCASIAAATNAFHALHGWWCEKKLVSVKFLREDRYYQRFAQAKKANTPLQIENIN